MKNTNAKKTLVFSEAFVKVNFLKELRLKKSLKNYTYINGLHPLTKVSSDYPFFIYRHFNLSPDLSQRLIPYFDYIDVNKNYSDPKINELKEIKLRLMDENIIQAFNLNNYQEIIQLDYSFLPNYLQADRSMHILEAVSSPVPVLKTKNAKEQVYAVYEKIVDLLEKGIPISQIKILNSTKEDDFQLKKLCLDAKIPLNNLKGREIKLFPIYKKIKESLLTQDIQETKNLIESLSQKHPDVMHAVIQVFNSYEEKLIKENIHIFIHQIEKIKIKAKRKNNSIEIIQLDTINDFDKHYLFMNYIDELFPAKQIDNDYLTNSQKRSIGLSTSEDMNQYALLINSKLFDTLENLYLFYPNKLIDTTRIANLKLKRPYLNLEYSLKAKEHSYLKNHDLLKYAIYKDLFDNYYQEADDYQFYKNTYENQYKTFNAQFTGINKVDLDSLLEKKYTLTGAKLESLKLCPFQYFLKYHLNFSDFAPNHYLYFGNMIHKSLEELIKDPDFNYELMIKENNDFPEDIIYKKALFDSILIDNIKEIYQIVLNFHQNSQYKKIITEAKHSFKLNESDRFKISGIVDKIMIDEEKGYYVVIDYKFSKKTFSVSEFERQLKLQLPFYMLMYQKISDLKASGLFFQKTSYQREKVNQKHDNVLEGVFLNNLQQMLRLDPEGKDITGLSYTKNGLRKSNRALSEEDFDAMQVTLEQFIYKAADKIERGDFEIKPILSEEKNNASISCLYCEFSNVCYSKNKYLTKGDDDEIYTESN